MKILVTPKKRSFAFAVLTAAGLLISSLNAQTSGLTGATNAQNAAVAEMEASVTPASQEIATARAGVISAIYASPSDIPARVELLRAAEEKAALARSAAFAEIQRSANKLSPDQVRILVWQAARPVGAPTRRPYVPPPPPKASGGADGFAGLGGRIGPVVSNAPDPVRLDDMQLTSVMRLDEQPEVERLAGAVKAARRALVTQIYGDVRDEALIRQKVAAVAAAEADLAKARAAAFERFQATSDHKLSADQLQTLASWNINARQGL